MPEFLNATLFLLTLSIFQALSKSLPQPSTTSYPSSNSNITESQDVEIFSGGDGDAALKESVKEIKGDELDENGLLVRVEVLGKEVEEQVFDDNDLKLTAVAIDEQTSLNETHNNGELVDDSMTFDMADLDDMVDLQFNIANLKSYLRQSKGLNVIENEELLMVEIDNIMKELNMEKVVDFKNKLKALKDEKMVEWNDELTSLVEKIVESAEFIIQTGKDRLAEKEGELVEEWEGAEGMYEKESMIDMAAEAHLDSFNEASDKVMNEYTVAFHEERNFSSQNLFLNSCLTMLVFIIICSLLAYKLTRVKKKVANRRVVSEVLSGDVTTW